ncbi:MAG: ATP-binding protein [Spirochaetes bacterium]|nr:ATP-binding protein [Spirochaetota bacterium]
MSENEQISILLLVKKNSLEKEILNQLKTLIIPYQYRIISRLTDVEIALIQEKWDVILADDNLTEFNAFDSLDFLTKINKDIPLIIISDRNDEEYAVEAMKRGASDYFNQNNIVKLAPAIIRELKEADKRRKDRQYHEVLSNQMDFYQRLFNALPVPMFYKNINGIYLGCNDYFAEKILGLSKNQIIGKSLFDFPTEIPREKAEIYREKDLYLFNNPGVQIYQAPVKCSDQKVRNFVFYKSTYQDNHAQTSGLLGAMFDVTDLNLWTREKHELTEKQNQTDKLKALGRFSTGIANQINGIVTLVHNCTQSIENQLSQTSDINHKFKKEFSIIHHEINRCNELTNQLMILARTGVIKKKYCLITDIIDSVLKKQEKMLQAENISVVREYESQSKVYCNSSHFHIVFENVLLNARLAIQAKRTGEIIITVTENKNFLTIAVKDNGTSFPDQNLQQLFSPFYFFSQLQESKSRTWETHFGLVVAQKIIMDHKGKVEIRNLKKGGSIFKIVLPTSVDIKEYSREINREQFSDEDLGYPTLVVGKDQDANKNLKKYLLFFGFSEIYIADTELKLDFFLNHFQFKRIIIDQDDFLDEKWEKLLNKQQKKALVFYLSEDLSKEKKTYKENHFYIKKPLDCIELLSMIQR